MAENFLKLKSDTKTQIQEAQRTLSKITTTNQPPIPKHIIFKLQKVKGKLNNIERNLYRGTKIRITSDFSLEIMQVRRECSEIFPVLREKRPHQLRILYPEKLSFQSERKIKTFSAKRKLKEFVASKPVL